MSKEEYQTTTIDKKTPIKMTLGTAAAVIAFCGVVVWQGAQIMRKLDNYHSECWHVEDMAEWTHQARAGGISNAPDISEILRLTRQKQ